MSTRCNIIFKSAYRNCGRIILYHHHDGYPSGVGLQLKKAFSKFEEWQFNQHGMSIATDLVANRCGLNDTEYEISTCVHGDIDYCYVVNCKARTIRCYKVRQECKGAENGYVVNKRKLFRRCNLVEIPEYVEGMKTIYEDE